MAPGGREPDREARTIFAVVADWKFDWLDVPGLIRDCSHAFEYPLVDRDPIPQWSFGRMTLMGDASYPMYPIGSNGAL